jgi:hypothetical protein
MKRTITGRAGARRMTLGELRQFFSSIEGLPDDALIKAQVTWRRHLRAVTVEEDDVGFREYVKAVGSKGDAERSKSGARSSARSADLSGIAGE